MNEYNADFERLQQQKFLTIIHLLLLDFPLTNILLKLILRASNRLRIKH